MWIKYGVGLLLLCGIFTVPGQALTLTEAMEAGLANSHALKEASYGTEMNRFKRESAESAFMPKVTTRYGYSQTNRGGDAGRDSSTAGVEVSLNLFNGLTDYNTYRSADSGYKARQFEEQGLVEDFKLSVIKAYIGVLSAEKALAVSTQAVAQLESQLATTRLSFKVGLLPKNDVLKVTSRTVAARRKVLESKSNVRVAAFNLEKVTGLSLEATEVFDDFSDQPSGSPDYARLETMMEENRSELKYLATLLEARGYAVDAAKGSWLPSVDLSAGWTSYGDSGIPDGRSYGYNDDTVVQANLRWTLFDGTARRSRLNIASSEAAQLREKLRETKLTLNTHLKTAFERYRVAGESYKAAHSEVDSARENYRVTEAMVKASSATTTDLLDANLILTRAENSRNEARYTMYKAMAEMERAVEAPLFFDNGKGFFYP